MKTPYPPKHSMMWVNSKNSFAETALAYAQDGNLISLTEKSDLPATDICGSPPETSMFWEGGTEKIELNEIEALACDYTRNEPDQEVETVHFVPVRYAIDEIESGETKPFGLPENWVGSGPARLKHHNYTLRQLRDGWLYVYDATTKALDEYEIKGSELTYYELGESEKVDTDIEADIERGVAQESKPYLSYPEGSLLSICFSQHRWTWNMFEMVANNPEKHASKMQTIVLIESGHQPHIASIDAIAEVADIEDSQVDDKRFVFSSLPTTEPEPAEGDDGASSVTPKPVAVASELTGSIPEDESAFLVAINDYTADIEDMAHHFTGYVAPYRLFEEQFSEQWTLMHAAMQLCMFGATNNKSLPPSAKTDYEKLSFYADMANYYESRDLVGHTKGLENIATEQAWASIPQDIANNKQDTLAAEIREKYNISEAAFGRYGNWVATDRWRRQLNWKSMLTEMRELTAERDKLLLPAIGRKQDFIAVMSALSTHHLEKIVDLWGIDTQFELQRLHHVALHAFILVMSHSDMEWADEQWAKPTCFWALFTSCFSPSIYQKIDRMVPEPLNVELNESDQDSDEGALPEPLSEELSNWSKGLGFYAKYNDFISNPNTYETVFLKDLGRGFQKLDQVFKASGKATLRSGAELGADFTAKTTISMLSAVNKPINRYSFLWRATFPLRMAQAAGIPVNENYVNDVKAWKSAGDKIDANINNQRAIVAAYKAGGQGVTHGQYLEARRRISNLELERTKNYLSYSLRIEVPADATQAMKRNIMSILDGATEKAHKHFEDLGALAQ
ncbi:toxin VasX [Vibrio mexicanus]|uniref:toxin VasX n=1 Tax=Vibrio mexicanus TaxID=1004326 RepID=UPI00069CB89D|nr:toxin VasX [Vibrio mexicanus]